MLREGRMELENSDILGGSCFQRVAIVCRWDTQSLGSCIASAFVSLNIRYPELMLLHLFPQIYE